MLRPDASTGYSRTILSHPNLHLRLVEVAGCGFRRNAEADDEVQAQRDVAVRIGPVEF